jgi:hypothetical protein
VLNRLGDSESYNQFCGTGSVESICFWASRILLLSSKHSKKKLDFYCLFCYFLVAFLSSKNDVKVPLFRIRIRIQIRGIRMFSGLHDPHPDPLVRGADSEDPDPQIQIRIKMLQIRNTGYSNMEWT